jgi:hypothetical protein
LRKTGRYHVALLRGIAFLAMVAIGSSPAAGQQPDASSTPPRFEAWGGFGVSFGGPSGTLASSYSPPLLLDGAFSSAATQTITLETGTAAGLQGGVNLFVTPRAGIQILVGGESKDLSGTSTPYSYTLTYTSRQPPNDQEVPVVVQSTTPWPAAIGSLADFRTSINGAVRLGPSGRASATISGGLTLHRLSGTLQPLAYTSFRLGGHSVLFTDDYRLSVALEPTMAVGFNIGGDVDVAVARHVALMIGLRYDGGPTAGVAARPDSVVNAEQIVFEQPLADIAQRLALPPAEVSLSAWRIVLAVKLTR